MRLYTKTNVIHRKLWDQNTENERTKTNSKPEINYIFLIRNATHWFHNLNSSHFI